MARIRASWVGGDNSNLNAHVGMAFSSDVGITVSGIWWRKTALAGPPTSVLGRIWRVSDQASLATTGTVNVTSQTAGTDNLLPLTASVTLNAGTNYLASVLWVGKADFNNVGDLASSRTSADGHVTIPASGAVFGNPADGDVYPSHGWPAAGFNGMFEVDIEYALSSETHSGTANVALAVSPAGAGNTVRAGTGPLTIHLAAAGGSGSCVVPRPSTGIVVRPFTGIVVEPC